MKQVLIMILLWCMLGYEAVSSRIQVTQALLRENVKSTKPSTPMHFHLHVNLNIAFPVGGLGVAFIIAILGWLYKRYKNRRNARLPVENDGRNEEPGIELNIQVPGGDTN
ncbi:hypothetical protein P8452_49205 [Trifolium repens]|nr:hypothetical protein P8452_49205 [Trifolium repens]